MSNFKEIKKEKNYLRLTLANVISTFGSSIDNIAFGWLIYQLVPDPRWIAIIFGSAMIPMVLFQPFIAVFVERWNKKTVCILSDIAGTLLMCFLLFLYFSENLNPWLLLAFTLINGLIETFRSPAGTALVPQILSKENFNIGISFSQTLNKTASLLGLTITGAIIAVGGLELAMIVDTITFILSALILFTISYKEDKIEEVEEVEKCDETPIKQKEKGRFKKEFIEGLVILRTSNYMMSVIVVAMGINFLTTAITTYMAIFMGDLLQFDAEIYSIASVIFTVGSLLGSLISSKICDKIQSKQIFLFGCLVQCLFYSTWVKAITITLFWLKLTLILGSVFVFGLIIGIIQVNVSVNFMKAVPKKYMSRISGLFNTLATSIMPFATIFFTITTGFITIKDIFSLFAILSGIFTCYLLFSKKITFHEEDYNEITTTTEV